MLYYLIGLQVSRVWINGFGNYEPGFDQLVDMQNGQALPETVTDGKTNSSLHATVDGLRTVQKSWAVQSDKSLIMIKLLKQLLGQDPFFAKTGLLLQFWFQTRKNFKCKNNNKRIFFMVRVALGSYSYRAQRQRKGSG